MEDEGGSIEVGKYAAFAVLDRNWFEIMPKEVADTKVLLTVFEVWWCVPLTRKRGAQVSQKAFLWYVRVTVYTPERVSEKVMHLNGIMYYC